MSLPSTALEALNGHWAVAAIGADELERAEIVVHQRLARRVVGKQISFTVAENAEDAPFLGRVALAYEFAAIEGLGELGCPTIENRLLRDQAVAASFQTFGIRCLLPVPEEIHDRLFFVLQLSAIAYRGDRRSDLLRWYREQGDDILITPSEVDTGWDHILLYRLFDCWVQLFRRWGRDDLDRIREIITGLRNDQNVHEARLLQNGSEALNRMIALRLLALYNWAKATETLVAYMSQGEPGDPFGALEKHFETGIKAASAAGDVQLEVVLRWLYATARIMVTNSPQWATRAVNSHS